MAKKLELAVNNLLTKELADQNGNALLKEDNTNLTVHDVVLAALSVAEGKHEDKLERWEAIKALKTGTLSTEQKELCKKWVARTVPSPVVCGQVLESL